MKRGLRKSGAGPALAVEVDAGDPVEAVLAAAGRTTAGDKRFQTGQFEKSEYRAYR
jgi:hypothetical protein